MEKRESTTEHGFLPGTTVASRAYSLTSPDADPGGDGSGCAWFPLCLDGEPCSPAFCASANSVFPPPFSMWLLPVTWSEDVKTDCFEMSCGVPANTGSCHKRAQACQAVRQSPRNAQQQSGCTPRLTPQHPHLGQALRCRRARGLQRGKLGRAECLEFPECHRHHRRRGTLQSFFHSMAGCMRSLSSATPGISIKGVQQEQQQRTCWAGEATGVGMVSRNTKLPEVRKVKLRDLGEV